MTRLFENACGHVTPHLRAIAGDECMAEDGANRGNKPL